jgi:hypothetical protein
LYKSRIISIFNIFRPFNQDRGKVSEIIRKEQLLIKPNYKYEKKQKDMAKQKKLEEKRKKKLEKRAGTAASDTSVPGVGSDSGIK